MPGGGGGVVHRRPRTGPSGAAAHSGDGPGWTHHLDPPALVALACRLYGAAPPVFHVSVGAVSFSVTEALSPPVEAALLAAVEAVAAVLTGDPGWIAGPDSGQGPPGLGGRVP